MKKLYFILILLLISVQVCFAGGVKTYKSPYFNYTIKYPDDWYTKNASGIIFLMSPVTSDSDDFSENINIIVQDIGKYKMNLKQYADYNYNLFPQHVPSFRLIDRGYTKVSGFEAYYMVYEKIDPDGRKVKHKVYTVLIGSIVYDITFSADKSEYDNYLPQAEQIIHSIKFGK
ncbi:MAG: PsbP-related protein [Candidatus Omnitrophica bacterium]|nr:PsbP-related protein [Candidatus Omnitrophota bacterium]